MAPSSSHAFEEAARHLEALSDLDRLQARGTLRIALKEAGYELSRETYRGEEVYWIQRLVAKPRQTGGIFRRGSSGGRSAPAVAGSGDGQRSNLSIFERRDGGGARFLVTFETDSSQEAKEALELLQAYRPRRGER